MNRKILSIIAVLVMLSAPLVMIYPDDSDATATTPVTVHPIPTDRLPWVTTVPIPYISSFFLNFTENPVDEVTKYVNGEITLDQLKTRCGYVEHPDQSLPYYEVNYGGGSTVYCTFHNIRSIHIISPFNIGLVNNPSASMDAFTNKDVSLEELKSTYTYTATPGPGEYRVIYENGWNWVRVEAVSGGDWTYSLNGFYNVYGLNFTKDPYDEVVKFVNKEITLEQLKTKCGYTESPDPSKPVYSVYYNNSNGCMTCGLNSSSYINLPGQNYRGEAYFTQNPYDEVVKYVNDEITLDELKTKCGYTTSRVAGTSYYYVSISGNGIDTWYNGEIVEATNVKYIQVMPKYVFLDKGEYHISVTDTDLEDVYINGLNKSSRYDRIEIKDRTGSGDIVVSSQDAIWLTGNTYGGGIESLENTWREKNITYTMDPAPTQGEKKTDFDRTVKVLPDKEWVKYTSKNALTGTYRIQTNEYVMFKSGSAEETEFIANVIDKNLMDGSGYGSKTIEFNGENVVLYTCRESSTDLSSYVWLNKTVQIEGGGTREEGERIECTAEKLSVSDVKPYKFYANYDFTIAVKYDTTKIRAVVMMYPGLQGTEYAVLESERVYDFHMIYSAEYELYAMPVSDSNGTLEPAEIGLYTGNVGSPDSNGMIFAVVAIVLCVMAFGILFLSGRRPKWGELEGLPSADTEIISTEAAVEDLSEAETPAEEPPKN